MISYGIFYIKRICGLNYWNIWRWGGKWEEGNTYAGFWYYEEIDQLGRTWVDAGTWGDHKEDTICRV